MPTISVIAEPQASLGNLRNQAMYMEPCPEHLDEQDRELWQMCRLIIEGGSAAPGADLQIQALYICRELRQESRANQLQAELDSLRLLLIRKNEALAIVASPAMWGKHQYQEATWRIWRGKDEFADPMAWAKKESEATECYDG